jgi:hypothetical protein
LDRFVDRDMVMRYHWGLGVGHIYSHGHHDQPIASGNSSKEDGTIVRPEFGPGDLDDPDPQVDPSLSPNWELEPDLVEQLEQTLAEGYTEKLDSDLEDGWDSDLDPYSGSEDSVKDHDPDSEDDMDLELFDMFGGTQAIMEFTSYD